MLALLCSVMCVREAVPCIQVECANTTTNGVNKKGSEKVKQRCRMILNLEKPL